MTEQRFISAANDYQEMVVKPWLEANHDAYGPGQQGFVHDLSDPTHVRALTTKGLDIKIGEDGLMCTYLPFGLQGMIMINSGSFYHNVAKAAEGGEARVESVLKGNAQAYDYVSLADKVFAKDCPVLVDIVGSSPAQVGATLVHGNAKYSFQLIEYHPSSNEGMIAMYVPAFAFVTPSYYWERNTPHVDVRDGALVMIPEGKMAVLGSDAGHLFPVGYGIAGILLASGTGQEQFQTRYEQDMHRQNGGQPVHNKLLLAVDEIRAAENTKGVIVGDSKSAQGTMEELVRQFQLQQSSLVDILEGR